ncbi:MAG: isoprenylcysteine carboxylmethyltransferase family protein [Pseudomonadota bacterium]
MSEANTPNRADRLQAQPPTRIPWPPLMIAVTVLSAIGLRMVFPLTWPGVDDLPARLVGLGFGVLGLGLIVWSAVTLNKHRTTIMPHRSADSLVTDGPFAWRRNPIYLGDVFLFLAAAEVTKNVWFAILVPVFMIAVTYLAILPEERHLEGKFGDAYRDYKERTRRWL